MSGNNTAFVTCLYSNLHGTPLGGRSARRHHYLQSLKTLLNTNCDFIVYASEEDTEQIQQTEGLCNNPKLKVITEDIFQHPDLPFFQKKKKDLNIVNDDRCYEIMHSKARWLSNHANDGYDFIYWIDCGLSYGSLFPGKYRSGAGFAHWFSCSLFNETMVSNLNKSANNLILLVADQKNNCMGPFPNDLLFDSVIEHKSRDYVVGGLFGGKSSDVLHFCESYFAILNKMKNLDVLQSEELLLTALYLQTPQKFSPLIFTSWHPEDSDMAIYNKPDDVSFYKIFEKLNN